MAAARAALQVAQSGALLVWSAGLLGAVASMTLPALQSALTYGRLTGGGASAAARWAERLPSVPKSWFTAFYAVGAATCTTAMALALAGGAGAAGGAALLPLLLLLLHELRRLGECLWLHAWGGRAVRMPLHLWLAGLAHYLGAPFSLLQAGGCGAAHGPPRWREPWPLGAAALGVALWAWGNYEQHASHALLAGLRRGTGGGAAGVGGGSAGRLPGALSAPLEGQPRRSPRRAAREGLGGPLAEPPPAIAPSATLPARYTLPSGRLFDLIVCPHYTAEVAVYVGLALVHSAVAAASGCAAREGAALRALPPALLAAWVAANLSATALHTRQWYALHFPAEAARVRRRAAIFPGML